MHREFDTGEYDNVLRRRLGRGEFVGSIEFVAPAASDEFEAALAPVIDLAERAKADARVHTIAVTDRVKSDDDHDPVRVAARVAEACRKAPTVHLSGKDRDQAGLADSFRRMEAAGLENLLLITGDKVKREPSGRRVRYHDSVDMIAQARAASPHFHIAAAVSPFKYREEELINQYLKMAKKELAGADCFITQIGWDMLKFKELLAYRRQRGLRAPVMAGVMLLTARRARYISESRLAGIVLTGGLQARLDEEARQPDRGVGAAHRRLALQIVGLKRLGYAGFQLTGMHHWDKLDELFWQVQGLDRELHDEGAWWDAWWDCLRGRDGSDTCTTPAHPFYLFEELGESQGWKVEVERLTPRKLLPAAASSAELRTFQRLDRLDRLLFKKGAVVLGPIARLVPPRSAVDRGLHWVERRIKEPIVGCQTCGFCRLPYSAYVCPETCPKGLANGPCGGTRDNICEFGDRECIHNRKYRIAKTAGRLEELVEVLIPPVDAAKRGTCSWTNHFRGEDPPVASLDDIRASESHL